MDPIEVRYHCLGLAMASTPDHRLALKAAEELAQFVLNGKQPNPTPALKAA